MKIEQRHWSKDNGWNAPAGPMAEGTARLALVFGATALLRDPALLTQIEASYPGALCLGCSTAGEIHGAEVAEGSLVATTATFQHTQLRLAQVFLNGGRDSRDAGARLAAQFPAALDTTGQWPLAHVLVLSDGLKVNGSKLVQGLVETLPAGVTVTGGLAGDGAAFGETLVWTGGLAASGGVAAVGFYGTRLRVGFGSRGGWDPFGPERMITRAEGNVLFEFDGQSALGLYKRYLGEHASGLPATGLLFPLSVRASSEDQPVVRTILSTDEARQSMTFAGDIPEGGYARLMKANFDRLIDGAAGAARTACLPPASQAPELAVLISCVGRRLVLKQRVEEEVEGVREITGPGTVLAGFYSYGEISPFTAGACCELHNQTMTITTFAET